MCLTLQCKEEGGSFTFEYKGTYHNPRFYAAKVKFSLKLVNKTDGTGYQMYSVTDDGGTTMHSSCGPIIVPNRLADFFFEKAVIEVLGGTEIEPSTQTHQITKLVHFHTTTKPEDAAFKYSNLGRYEEKYNSTSATQLHQVPITIGTNGAITATTGANYKQITRTQFINGPAPNATYTYTTSGAAKLADKFYAGAEVQLEVPLRRICRVANCQQMFPSGKKFFITLYKADESFLFTCQDPAAHQKVIFQMTDCTIEVPVVELTDDLKEEE